MAPLSAVITFQYKDAENKKERKKQRQKKTPTKLYVRAVLSKVCSAQAKLITDLACRNSETSVITR